MNELRVPVLLIVVAFVGTGYLSRVVPKRLESGARTSGMASRWTPPEGEEASEDLYERFVQRSRLNPEASPFRTRVYLPPPPPPKKDNDNPKPPPKTSETVPVTYTGLYRSGNVEASVFLLVGDSNQRFQIGAVVVGPYRLSEVKRESVSLVDPEGSVVAVLPFRQKTEVNYPLTPPEP